MRVDPVEELAVVGDVVVEATLLVDLGRRVGAGDAVLTTLAVAHGLLVPDEELRPVPAVHGVGPDADNDAVGDVLEILRIGVLVDLVDNRLAHEGLGHLVEGRPFNEDGPHVIVVTETWLDKSAFECTRPLLGVDNRGALVSVAKFGDIVHWCFLIHQASANGLSTPGSFLSARTVFSMP